MVYMGGVVWRKKPERCDHLICNRSFNPCLSSLYLVLLCVRRVLVSLYNPMLSFVSLMVLPLSEIYAHPSDMLAVMAEKLGGSTFRTILCIDAVTILCGGVLTSIVGKFVPAVILGRDLLI
jgi:hypothetical protein